MLLVFRCGVTELSVWDDLVVKAQKMCDLTNSAAITQIVIYNLAADALRILKADHPEFVATLILLSLPKLGESASDT